MVAVVTPPPPEFPVSAKKRGTISTSPYVPLFFKKEEQFAVLRYFPEFGHIILIFFDLEEVRQ